MLSQVYGGNQSLSFIPIYGNYQTPIQAISTLCRSVIGKIQSVAQRILGQQAGTAATYLFVAITLCTALYALYKMIMIIQNRCCSEQQNTGNNDNKNINENDNKNNNNSHNQNDDIEYEHYINSCTQNDFDNIELDHIQWNKSTPRENLIQSLEAWVNDPKVKGEKQTAYERILEAFDYDAYRLDLRSLDLSELPSCIGQLTQLGDLLLNGNNLTCLPAEIGQLTQLKNLALQDNKLTSLPPEIGQLAQLKKLILGSNLFGPLGNKLTNLPPEIGKLLQLEELDVSNNQLTTLPSTIGQLSQLQSLELRRNKISILPSTIGQLRQLKELILGINELSSIPRELCMLTALERVSLSGNKLTSLPPEIGNLLNAKRLTIYDNPELTEIPLSLGQIPGLTDLDCSGTKIPEETKETILRLCQSKREEKVIENFSNHVNAWLVYGDHKMDPKEFEKSFADDEKKSIDEWLLRLEKTDDYSGCQKKLAKVVCGILQTLTKDDDFKKLFFDQVRFNNQACHDRAAMALNELYVAWRIHTLDKETSAKEKITFMIQAAKTTALRRILTQKIIDWELKNKTILGESVETYLYYEKTLQKELGLLTVIERMSYELWGKHDWIDSKALVDEVNDSYLDDLVNIPSFQTLIEKEKSFQDIWIVKVKEKEYDTDQNILEEYTDDDIEKTEKFKESWTETAKKYFKNADFNDFGYSESLKGLAKAKEKTKTNLMKEWIQKVL